MEIEKKSIIILFILTCFTMLIGQNISKNKTKLFISVIGEDGIVIPFAKYHNGSWCNPWTEPFEEEEGISFPNINLPNKWFFYSNELYQIKTLNKVLTDVHCLHNWGFTSDYKNKVHREKYSVRNIIGVVFSDSIELIDDTKLIQRNIDIDKIFKELGLIDRPERTENHVHYERLGNIIIDNKVFNIIRVVGYEGESYEIYELSPGKGLKLLDVYGGGC